MMSEILQVLRRKPNGMLEVNRSWRERIAICDKVSEILKTGVT
jgi:hypothetical protein